MIGAWELAGATPPRFLDPRPIDVVPEPQIMPESAAISDGVVHNDVDVSIDQASRFLNAAIDQATRRVKRFPNSSRAFVSLGQAFMNHDRLDKAEDAFETALGLDPTNASAAARLGRLLAARGESVKANELLVGANARIHGSAELLRALGEVAVIRGDENGAIDFMIRAVTVDPSGVMSRLALGQMLVHVGRHKDAIPQLRIALQGASRLPAAYQALGMAQSEMGNLKSAIQAFQTALSLRPSADVTRRLANAFIRNGQSAKATEVIRKALETYPNDRKLHELLAWAHYRENDYKAARTELMKVIGIVSDSDAETNIHQARLLNNLGACLCRMGNLEEGQRQLQRSIELQPDSPVPYHSYAGILMLDERLKGYEKAFEILQRCEARRFPNDDRTRLMMSGALYALARFDAAIQVIQDWISCGEATPMTWAALGHLFTDGKGDADKAIEALCQARDLFPNDPLIDNNLAYSYLIADKPTEARNILESMGSSVKMAPPELHAVLHATWGLLHLKEGDARRAEVGYRRAEREATDMGNEPLARAAGRKKHLEFARAYRHLGDLEAARSETQRGLGIQGSDPYFYRRDLRTLAEELRSNAREQQRNN